MAGQELAARVVKQLEGSGFEVDEQARRFGNAHFHSARGEGSRKIPPEVELSAAVYGKDTAARLRSVEVLLFWTTVN